MTDPFEALREPITAARPDPAFAAALRARIERALALPEGVTPVTTGTPLTIAGAAIPYLVVRDAAQAIDWYVDVFGVELRSDPIVMPDGRIGHSELALGAGVLYLADEFPDIGAVAPTPDAASVSLVLTVPDTDTTVAQAVARGARLTREIYEAYGHRNATIVDPFGHRWLLQGPTRPV
jgi:uncharacterized glyoxalase superfamily protein PhnB